MIQELISRFNYQCKFKIPFFLSSPIVKTFSSKHTFTFNIRNIYIEGTDFCGSFDLESELKKPINS